MAASSYPRLAGLDATYLARQLRGFKSGERHSPVMAPMTAALSDADIDALARYYAALPAPSLPPASASEQQLEQGKALANLGRWSDNIPACVQCHGPDGRGVPPHFPAISGQYAGYIAQQLQAWQSGQRTGDPDELMATVAKRLSAADIQAVAAWFQAVPAAASDSAN
jgi:cytochrome c553